MVNEEESNLNLQYEFSMDAAADMLIEFEDACSRGDCSYDYQITEMKMVGLTPQRLYNKYYKS